MTSILGIENRTENWRTAVYFSPMFRSKSYKFAQMLGASSAFSADQVTIELFWSGIRDYRHREGLTKLELMREIVTAYEKKFSNLRSDVKSFSEFSDLKEYHYLSNGNKVGMSLTSNLIGTEVDVILETPKELFIGEVKHESTFGASGRLVLVHQLIRQYVAASVLLELTQTDKEIIPFVVGDRTDYLNKTSQVRFMVNQGWLNPKNVLNWEDVELTQIR